MFQSKPKNTQRITTTIQQNKLNLKPQPEHLKQDTKQKFLEWEHAIATNTINRYGHAVDALKLLHQKNRQKHFIEYQQVRISCFQAMAQSLGLEFYSETLLTDDEKLFNEHKNKSVLFEPVLTYFDLESALKQEASGWDIAPRHGVNITQICKEYLATVTGIMPTTMLELFALEGSKPEEQSPEFVSILVNCARKINESLAKMKQVEYNYLTESQLDQVLENNYLGFDHATFKKAQENYLEQLKTTDQTLENSLTELKTLLDQAIATVQKTEKCLNHHKISQYAAQSSRMYKSTCDVLAENSVENGHVFHA